MSLLAEVALLLLDAMEPVDSGRLTTEVMGGCEAGDGGADG